MSKELNSQSAKLRDRGRARYRSECGYISDPLVLVLVQSISMYKICNKSSCPVVVRRKFAKVETLRPQAQFVWVRPIAEKPRLQLSGDSSPKRGVSIPSCHNS